MKKTTSVLGLVFLCATGLFASTINGETDTIGTSFLVTLGAGNVKFSDLVNSTMSVTFVDSVGNATCTFTNFSGNNIGCNTGSFEFLATPQTSQTNSATWSILNLRGAGFGSNITSVTINLLPSNVGFDQGTITSKSPLGNLSADATLTNALHLSSETPASASHYAVLILNNFVGFDGGSEFDYKAQTAFLASATADVPEPATYAMVGAALAGLGVLRLRRRKRSSQV